MFRGRLGPFSCGSGVERQAFSPVGQPSKHAALRRPPPLALARPDTPHRTPHRRRGVKKTQTLRALVDAVQGLIKHGPQWLQPPDKPADQALHRICLPSPGALGPFTRRSPLKNGSLIRKNRIRLLPRPRLSREDDSETSERRVAAIIKNAYTPIIAALFLLTTNSAEAPEAAIPRGVILSQCHTSQNPPMQCQ